MRHHAPLKWVILPGNHDSLQAAQLWATLKAEAPDNVLLAVGPQPLSLAPEAMLLPAPCTTRRPGRDLTEWMDGAATEEGVMRIGLAHGAIQRFSEDSDASDVIAPDRARRAGLDYLALGDWHGSLTVDPRTRYSGSPEPDRFKHDRPGHASLVTIEGRNALPEVRELETGAFAWTSFPLELLDGDDPISLLANALPELRSRRQILARVVASGHVRLPGRTALAAAVEEAAPDFAFLELDDDALATECEAGDLDLIDRAGALREAADTLLTEAEDEGRSTAERDIARAALTRLFSYCETIGS
jgi:DNA repair exonuclease SbcCD nuclease subunit